MIKLRPLYCGICGRLRVRPLFFVIERSDHWPICHTHVDGILGIPGAAATLGPWEAWLSGDTSIVKVRK